MIAWPSMLVPVLAPPPPPVVIFVPLFSAVHVFGPTTPSTPIPAEDCRARTALMVRAPKTPSTVSEAPFAFRLAWRVFTALPRAPWRSFGWLDGAEMDPPEVAPWLRADQVRGPTTPSTRRPAEDCAACTARSVAEPKTPSTFRLAPWALSCFWR